MKDNVTQSQSSENNKNWDSCLSSLYSLCVCKICWHTPWKGIGWKMLTCVFVSTCLPVPYSIYCSLLYLIFDRLPLLFDGFVLFPCSRSMKGWIRVNISAKLGSLSSREIFSLSFSQLFQTTFFLGREEFNRKMSDLEQLVLLWGDKIQLSSIHIQLDTV